MDILFTLFLLSLGSYGSVFCEGNTPVYKCDEGVLPEVNTNLKCTTGTGRCLVPPGIEVQVNMTFRSPNYLEHIVPKVIARVFDIDVPFNLGVEDACEDVVNTPCPLVENEYIEYAMRIPIPGVLPKVTLQLTFWIYDKDNNDEKVICFNVDLEVDPPK